MIAIILSLLLSYGKKYIHWSAISNFVTDEVKKYPVFIIWKKHNYNMLIKAIIQRESSFNLFAKSKDNCRGLMQVSPQLLRDINRMRKHKILLYGLYFYDVNIRYGIEYYAKCYVKAQGNIIHACTLYLYGINSGKKSSQYGKDILKYYKEYLK